MFSDVSVLLALIIGSSSILLGSLFIVKNQLVTRFLEGISERNRFSIFFALSELIAGSIIVYLHNKWLIGYEGLITLIGWYLVVDSVADLLIPESLRNKLGSTLEQNEEEADTVNEGVGVLLILIGLYLLYSVV